jgi:hypothetical protein
VGFFWRFRVHGEGRSLCFKNFDAHLVVPGILGAPEASDHPWRKAGKKKLADSFLIKFLYSVCAFLILSH